MLVVFGGVGVGGVGGNVVGGVGVVVRVVLGCCWGVLGCCRGRVGVLLRRCLVLG